MLTKITLRPLCLIAGILLLHACSGGGSGGDGPSSGGTVGSSSNSGGSSLPAVSYYSAAKPLLDRYCVNCHNAEGVAPFPLESYAQVYGKRSALVYVLESGAMPPLGFAGPNANDTALLLGWLADGAPEGDASQTPVSVVTGQYTYHRDVRPIMEAKCEGCHVEGGIAPFPFGSYQSVVAVAAAAAFSVRNGSMPPWLPTKGYTPFRHEGGLKPEQKYILLDWLEGDLAEGNPADYVAADAAVESNPLDFNLTLKMPQAYTPTVRPDDHRCFAIEWPLDEFTYVTGVDVTPDQVEEVHHVIVSIAEPEDAALYYAAGGQDGRPGWHCLGAGGVSGAPLPRQIGGWVPGAGRERSAKGLGTGVKPGSVMVVQMHYNTLVSEPVPDQSLIRVATADEVDRPARGFLLTDPRWLSPGGMPIPAGDPAVSHEIFLPAFILANVFGQEAGLTGADPWVMHQGFLHMHGLGSGGRTTLIRADGTQQVILDVRKWDFNWQSTYGFDRELLIQPNDLIKLECTWDNSQQNQQFVDGVQQITKYVEWGDGTGDEMCLMSILMSQPLANYDYSYSPSVYVESPVYRQRFAAGDLVPLKLILNNFALHDPDEAEDEGHDQDHSQLYTGHYHVYLDEGTEPLIGWDDNYYFPLPDDMAPGIHTLRVDLRGPDHHALGIGQSVEIDIAEQAAAQSNALVDADSWVEQGAGDDSLAAHRPANVDCPVNSWYNEDGALEVETGYCNYLSVSQPSKAAIRAGDTVHLVLWHADLAFEKPASAHVAVSIAGQLIWEAEVNIPTKAEIYDLRIPVAFDAPEGSTVEYHLHNHGYNSWTLLELEVER